MVNTKKKSVFLITIDALRPDHLKAYGYRRNTAPNLEEFIKMGIKYENAYTNGPATPSSFSAIFTSMLPLLSGGYSPLPREKISFPQILKEYGIKTYAIHSNPNLGKLFSYDRGFDVFLDGERYKKEKNSQSSLKESIFGKVKLLFENTIKKLLYQIKGFNRIKNWFRTNFPIITELLLPFTPMAYNAPYVVNKTTKFLLDSKDPIFCWIHFMDVHSPYNPPARNVKKFRGEDFDISYRKFLNEKVYGGVRDQSYPEHILEDIKLLYDAQINFIDDYLKDLIDLIKKKYGESVLVIITADHGESFNEHGTFGHQGSVYEELLKVPFFLITPKHDKESITINNEIQLIDIAPTILNYFDIPIPEDFQGISLLNDIKEKKYERKRDRIIFSECYQKQGMMKRTYEEGYILLAIKKGIWKYIFDEEKNQEFLFNLREDPKEQINLIDKNNEIAGNFQLLRRYHLNKIKKRERSKLVKRIRKLDL